MEREYGARPSSALRLAHQPLHLGDGFAHADEYRAADDGVADVQFADAGQGRHRLHVEVVER